MWLHCVQHWELSLDVVNYPSNAVVYWHPLPHTPSLRCATGMWPVSPVLPSAYLLLVPSQCHTHLSSDTPHVL